MLRKGIYFMLFATIFFLVVKIGVKLLPHIPAMEIVFFRCLISFVISYVILKSQDVYIFGNNKFLLCMRGIFGTIGLYLYFVILQNIPLATASTIIYLTPVFTSLIGVFILKEKMSLLQWICISFAFLGILLIQGYDQRVTPNYLLLGLLGSFCAGCAYNIIRYLRKKEHSLVLMIYFPMIACPIGGVISYFNWENPSLYDLSILIGIGVVTQFAQYFMTKSFQSDKVSTVSIITYSEILFVIAIGYKFFDESFNTLTYIGMFMVVSSVIISILYSSSKFSLIEK